MKKILIIGGTRFIGPALIKYLQKDNVQITIFNRGNNYNKILPKNIIRIIGDRRNVKTMRILKEIKYDLIYDLCCFNKIDAINLLTNIQPTANIVFLSTAAAYKKPLIYPLTENSKLGEWSPFGDYGTSKVEAELEFIKYARRNKRKTTIFRPVYLLGNGNYFDRENFYFSRILNKDPILIPGNGEALIQFAFLEEVAFSFYSVPQKQKEQIEILNVAGNDCITIKDLVNLCSKIVHKRANIIELDTKLFGLNEEHFYDDFYPFPNLTFIASNRKIVDKYNIKFKQLEIGLKQIFINWKKKWNGITKKYPLEIEILKKIYEKK